MHPFPGTGRATVKIEVKTEEPEEDNKAIFPNNQDRVNEISNAGLLKELLSALDKFHCLEVPVENGRWVRAFCDLYHPTGPWGENKFKNVPNHTSERRDSFKSYIIPEILELLQKCGHRESSEPHRQLYNKFKDFKSKEDYYKKFMEHCNVLAMEQTRKQPSDRDPTLDSRLVEFRKKMPPLLAGEYDTIIPMTSEGLLMNVGEINGSVAFRSYRRFPDKSKGPAETSNLIRGAGDRLIAVDGVSTISKTFKEVIGLLRECRNNKYVFMRLLEAKFANRASKLPTSANKKKEKEKKKNSPQPMAAAQESKDPSEPTREQASDSNSPKTSETDTADRDNAPPGPDAATVDDEASLGCNFEDKETTQETNVAETKENTVESTITDTAVDQASRTDAPHSSDTETSGEKRLASSSDMPSPKRRRLETNKQSSGRPCKPASPDTKEVSGAPVRAVSPDTQRGLSHDREQLLNRKRKKLSNMLKQRRENLYGEEDRMIVKIREHIDDIDEELLNLILAE